MRQAAGALPASVGQHSCGDKARIPNGLTPDSSPGMAHTDSAGHHSNEGECEEPGRHNAKMASWPVPLMAMFSIADLPKL